MLKEENIQSLSIEDLLGLLNSPKKEIVNEVKALIKDQFSSVNDRCLISGFLDYYFLTKSKHILDLLLDAPEPHSRYLLEKISAGFRGGDRFNYLSVLLYAISKNPPPIWVHKIPSTPVLKDLMEILVSSKEFDLNVLVSGVMVLILLLPMLPYEFNKHLPKLFDCFWRLVNWVPIQEHDSTLKPYLQVALYNLFHRLYALYPCNFLGFLRSNVMTLRMPDKNRFMNTLRPMLEQVRLHPLLISETKDTEVQKNRWMGLEPNDIIHKCARLSLDPFHEICEEMHLSYPSQKLNIREMVPVASDFTSLCSSENSFWSPGAFQSPNSTNTSVSLTPVYSLHLLGSNVGIVAESPPEAAVEATPETTPFTSPTQYIGPKHDASRQIFTKLKAVSINEVSQEDNSSASNPLSPIKKEIFPFQCNLKNNEEGVFKNEKSDILQSKLQEIQHQRITRQKELEALSQNTEYFNPLAGSSRKFVNSSEQMNVKGNRQSETADKSFKKEPLRKRKFPVLSNKDIEIFNPDLFCEEREEKEEEDISGKERDPSLDSVPLNCEVNVKHSDDIESCNNEGLGLLSRHSMTELVKNVRTNRLRFLSQCGPPPNISLLSEQSSKSPKKPLFFQLKHKSFSFPNLRNENSSFLPGSETLRQNFTSSFTFSPIKPSVDVFDAATQTEEIPVVDPYEQLLELSMKTLSENKRSFNDGNIKSPYEYLDNFIENWSKDSGTEIGVNDSARTAKNHLRAIQCERMFERYKREVHAERNRRLLGKIKQLHLLQEKNQGLHREMNAMKDEMISMHCTISKLQEQKNILEKKVQDMVEKQLLFEVQEKQINAFRQRDHLKVMCENLRKEKYIMTKEIENLKNSFREIERQHKIHMRHSTDNASLRNQVEDLNKKILIMGEIQLEMHQQMKNYKESQQQYRSQALAQEKASFSQLIKDLEYKNKDEKMSLEAAMFHIRDLECKLIVGKKESLSLREEVETTTASWKERCDALEKRNKELNSVNITLKNRITQLMSDTGQDGRISTFHFPEPSPGSCIEMMTSNEFKPTHNHD